MLAKCQLTNGKNKIVAIEGSTWEDVLDKIQFKTFKWIRSLGKQDSNLCASIHISEYLQSKGITSISDLTFKDEQEIAGKVTS